MICPSCTEAGELLVNIKKMDEKEAKAPFFTKEELLGHVKDLHEDCNWPASCPCHHIVELSGVINTERIVVPAQPVP